MAELHGPLHEGGGKSGLTGKHISIPMVAGIVVVGGILAFVMMRGGSSHAGASSGTGAQVNPGAVSPGDISALSQQMQGFQSNASNLFSDLAAKFPSVQTGTKTVAGRAGESMMVVEAGPGGMWKNAGSLPGGIDITSSMGSPISAMWPTGADSAGRWTSTPSPFQAVPFTYGGKQYYTNAIGLSNVPAGRGSGPYLIASGPTANA